MSYFGSIGRKTVRIMVTIGTPVSTVLLSTKTPVRNFFCQNKDFGMSLCTTGEAMSSPPISCRRGRRHSSRRRNPLRPITSSLVFSLLLDVEEDGVGFTVEAVEGGDGVAEAGLGVGDADTVERGQCHDGLAVADV